MKDLKTTVFRYFSRKTILGFMLIPILMNVVSEVIGLWHFNTFTGFPVAQMFENVSFYSGNWPSLLLKMYPYVIAGGGEVVYDSSGWMAPLTFIINLLGWSLVGFISSYAIRKSKKDNKAEAN